MKITKLLPSASLVLACSLVTAGCSLATTAGGGQEQAATSSEATSSAGSSSSSATASASATATGPALPGYEPGQFPEVPAITIPDVSLLTDSAPAFSVDLEKALSGLNGVTVTAAQCDEGGPAHVGKRLRLALRRDSDRRRPDRH